MKYGTRLYGSCLYGMGYHFVSQLTNVNRFSKGEPTETATELACFMVSDYDSCPTGRLSRRRRVVYI